MSIDVIYNATSQLYRMKHSNLFSTRSLIFFVFMTVFLTTIILKMIKMVKIYKNNKFILFFGSPEGILKKILAVIETYSGPTPLYFWLAFIPFACVDKPEDLQFVLNNSSTLGKSYLYNFFTDVVGTGLFSAPVKKWKRHRRIIAPTFNLRLMENFFEIFNRKNRLLIEKLKKESGTNEHFDLWKYISSTNLEIICETTMGFNSDCEEVFKQFEEAQEKVIETIVIRIYKPWLHLDIIFNMYAYFTGFRKKIEILNELPMQIIQRRKNEFMSRKLNSQNEIDENGNNKFDKTFLDVLLDLNEQGAGFTDDDIRDEVVTMMIGGYETSAITNCFTLLMFGMNPDIQDKVYEEINGILGTDDAYIEMKDVQKMTYLEQCIQETLRLFPPGPIILRQTSETVTLSNDFVVPKNTTVVIPPIRVHRHADYYKDPLIWNPDNFTAEEISKRHKYTFLAFSGGPRGCIGAKYAMLSMKVTISMILLNYRISTDVRMEDIKLKTDLLMKSVDGYKIKLHRRRTE